MAAGGPGDHPLSDIIRYRIATYDTTTDNLIRELSELLSPRELDEWWSTEIGWLCSASIAASKSQAKLAWAQTRAKHSGWEFGPA